MSGEGTDEQGLSRPILIRDLAIMRSILQNVRPPKHYVKETRYRKLCIMGSLF